MVNYNRPIVYAAAIISWLVCQNVRAQVPQANKPVVGGGGSPAALSPEALPAAYSSGSRLSYVKSFEAVMPLSEMPSFDAAGRTDVRQSTTYFDGLGRPLQTVMRDAVSDVVLPVVYDGRGRETRRYLPFARAGDGGFSSDPFAEQQVFYQSGYKDPDGALAYPGELFYYGSTRYEASPLNRPEKIMTPGNGWAGNGRGKQTSYGSNSARDELPVWLLGNDQFSALDDGPIDIPVMSSFYPDNALSVLSVIDEDHKQILEYRDHRGLVVFKQVVMGEERANWLTTCYVYDEMARLRFVLPPAAITEMKANWLLSQDIVKERCFVNRYDALDV